jgi:hypothetical protein
MKNKYSILVTAFLALWLVIGVTACSDDNSTGAEQEDCNTSLPSEFAPATVDQTYFNQQTEPDPQDEQYTNYFQVQQVATTGSAFFAGGAGPFSLASALLLYAQFAEISPDFENGSCIWEITPPASQVGGLDLTVTVKATPTSNGVNWEIIYDGELSEGEVVNDFKILTGFTSNDEQTGEWNYYAPEAPNNAALTYTWDIESENNFELNVSAIASEFGIATISYTKNGVENNMTFDDGETSTEVYWNEETDSGWIDDGEEQRCYTDFVNSACS